MSSTHPKRRQAPRDGDAPMRSLPSPPCDKCNRYKAKQPCYECGAALCVSCARIGYMRMMGKDLSKAWRCVGCSRTQTDDACVLL
jgi:hypothetical protein